MEVTDLLLESSCDSFLLRGDCGDPWEPSTVVGPTPDAVAPANYPHNSQINTDPIQDVIQRAHAEGSSDSSCDVGAATRFATSAFRIADLLLEQPSNQFLQHMLPEATPDQAEPVSAAPPDKTVPDRLEPVAYQAVRVKQVPKNHLAESHEMAQPDLFSTLEAELAEIERRYIAKVPCEEAAPDGPTPGRASPARHRRGSSTLSSSLASDSVSGGGGAADASAGPTTAAGAPSAPARATSSRSSLSGTTGPFATAAQPTILARMDVPSVDAGRHLPSLAPAGSPAVGGAGHNQPRSEHLPAWSSGGSQESEVQDPDDDRPPAPLGLGGRWGRLGKADRSSHAGQAAPAAQQYAGVGLPAPVEPRSEGGVANQARQPTGAPPRVVPDPRVAGPEARGSEPFQGMYHMDFAHPRLMDVAAEGERSVGQVPDAAHVAASAPAAVAHPPVVLQPAVPAVVGMLPAGEQTAKVTPVQATSPPGLARDEIDGDLSRGVQPGVAMAAGLTLGPSDVVDRSAASSRVQGQAEAHPHPHPDSSAGAAVPAVSLLAVLEAMTAAVSAARRLAAPGDASGVRATAAVATTPGAGASCGTSDVGNGSKPAAGVAAGPSGAPAINEALVGTSPYQGAAPSPAKVAGTRTQGEAAENGGMAMSPAVRGHGQQGREQLASPSQRGAGHHDFASVGAATLQRASPAANGAAGAPEPSTPPSIPMAHLQCNQQLDAPSHALPTPRTQQQQPWRPLPHNAAWASAGVEGPSLGVSDPATGIAGGSGSTATSAGGEAEHRAARSAGTSVGGRRSSGAGSSSSLLESLMAELQDTGPATTAATTSATRPLLLSGPQPEAGSSRDRSTTGLQPAAVGAVTAPPSAHAPVIPDAAGAPTENRSGPPAMVRALLGYGLDPAAPDLIPGGSLTTRACSSDATYDPKQVDEPAHRDDVCERRMGSAPPLARAAQTPPPPLQQRLSRPVSAEELQLQLQLQLQQQHPHLQEGEQLGPHQHQSSAGVQVHPPRGQHEALWLQPQPVVSSGRQQVAFQQQQQQQQQQSQPQRQQRTQGRAEQQQQQLQPATVPALLGQQQQRQHQEVLSPQPQPDPGWQTPQPQPQSHPQPQAQVQLRPQQAPGAPHERLPHRGDRSTSPHYASPQGNLAPNEGVRQSAGPGAVQLQDEVGAGAPGWAGEAHRGVLGMSSSPSQGLSVAHLERQQPLELPQGPNQEARTHAQHPRLEEQGQPPEAPPQPPSPGLRSRQEPEAQVAPPLSVLQSPPQPPPLPAALQPALPQPPYHAVEAGHGVQVGGRPQLVAGQTTAPAAAEPLSYAERSGAPLYPGQATSAGSARGEALDGRPPALQATAPAPDEGQVYESCVSVEQLEAAAGRAEAAALAMLAEMEELVMAAEEQPRDGDANGDGSCDSDAGLLTATEVEPEAATAGVWPSFDEDWEVQLIRRLSSLGVQLDGRAPDSSRGRGAVDVAWSPSDEVMKSARQAALQALQTRLADAQARHNARRQRRNAARTNDVAFTNLSPGSPPLDSKPAPDQRPHPYHYHSRDLYPAAPQHSSAPTAQPQWQQMQQRYQHPNDWQQQKPLQQPPQQKPQQPRGAGEGQPPSSFLRQILAQMATPSHATAAGAAAATTSASVPAFSSAAHQPTAATTASSLSTSLGFPSASAPADSGSQPPSKSVSSQWVQYTGMASPTVNSASTSILAQQPASARSLSYGPTGYAAVGGFLSPPSPRRDCKAVADVGSTRGLAGAAGSMVGGWGDSGAVLAVGGSASAQQALTPGSASGTPHWAGPSSVRVAAPPAALLARSLLSLPSGSALPGQQLGARLQSARNDNIRPPWDPSLVAAKNIMASPRGGGAGRPGRPGAGSGLWMANSEPLWSPSPGRCRSVSSSGAAPAAAAGAASASARWPQTHGSLLSPRPQAPVSPSAQHIYNVEVRQRDGAAAAATRAHVPTTPTRSLPAGHAWSSFSPGRPAAAPWTLPTAFDPASAHISAAAPGGSAPVDGPSAPVTPKMTPRADPRARPLSRAISVAPEPHVPLPGSRQELEELRALCSLARSLPQLDALERVQLWERLEQLLAQKLARTPPGRSLQGAGRGGGGRGGQGVRGGSPDSRWMALPVGFQGGAGAGGIYGRPDSPLRGYATVWGHRQRGGSGGSGGDSSGGGSWSSSEQQQQQQQATNGYRVHGRGYQYPGVSPRLGGDGLSLSVAAGRDRSSQANWQQAVGSGAGVRVAAGGAGAGGGSGVAGGAGSLLDSTLEVVHSVIAPNATLAHALSLNWQMALRSQAARMESGAAVRESWQHP